MHLSNCLFLSVAQVICLTSCENIPLTDLFCWWPVPSQFACAARHLWETANCCLCKTRHLFVTWLEMLHIWMWRDSCFPKAVTGTLQMQARALITCTLNWHYLWHCNKAMNHAESFPCSVSCWCGHSFPLLLSVHCLPYMACVQLLREMSQN